MSSESSEQELVSRKKFLQKMALATAAGAGVATAGEILRVPGARAVSTDQLVKISSTDTTADFLNPKVAPGTRISTRILNPSGSQQLQISVSDEVMPASYVIYMSGSTILARNGLTGKDDYSGTDAAAVIQNAINALPPAGGIIFIRAGTYPISMSAPSPQSPIGLPSGVVIQGEGVDRTIITSPQGFFYGAPVSASQVSNIAVRDLTLNSLAPSGGAIGSGGYFFIADHSANALRFERVKMLGGGNVGTGVVLFPGVGGPPGNYSDIQFIDVWADSQGSTSGNEFFVFAEYSLSNVKFKRCYVKNTSGPNVGFFSIASASNVAFRDCTVESGGIYMGVPSSSLPVMGRISFDDCYFVNFAGFGTGGSPTMQWIEAYFRGCISETPFGVGGNGIYHLYLSDSWVLGTRSVPSSGYASNVGNITIRGGGLVDGWNSSNLAWYNGGSAISIPTGQPALSQMFFDVSGFRIGLPASGTSPGGILIPYSSTQNLRMKIVASFMPSSIPSVLANQPGGINTLASGTNWLNTLVNTGNMPKQHTLIGLTDEAGNRYAYPQGVASITGLPTPAPTASFTYPNSDGVPEAIYVVGGTVSQVVKNGVTLFTTTNVTVWLEPGESLTVTYSSTPSMLKDRK